MVTFATAHNGGKSQINMNYMPTSGDYPFINMLKGATTGWSMESGVSQIPPSQLTSDGYPNDLTNTGGGVYIVVQTPRPLEKPGNWTLRWTGSGCTLAVAAASGSTTTVSGSSTSSPWVFSLTDTANTGITVAIFSIGTGISDISLVHSADDTDFLAGQTFSAKFKAKLREANFGVIRFLNWLNINTNSSTVWAYRKPLTYWSWAAYQYPPELYAGASTNTAADYSVSVPSKHSSDGTTWTNGQAPKDKDTIIVRFGAAITTGAMTLKVGTGGSSSAIAVVNPGCNVLSTGGNDFPLANRLATFIYDAGLAKWIKWGGDIANGFDTGIDNGIPIEAALQLCAEVGAHPWFGFPVYALDPMTDYAPSCITYVHSNQQSWMVPRFEVSNELWNGLFFSTGYAPAKAAANGWTSPSLHQWYGKAVSTLGQAVNAVYGGSPHTQTAYQMCCGVQTGTANTLLACATSDERMTSAAYFNQAAAAQSGYTKSHAYDWITHVTCANYFNPVGDRSGDGNPAPLEGTLVTAVGGVLFTISSCSGGNLVVATPGAADTTGLDGTMLHSGMTMVGLAISAGTTITGGTFPNLTISDVALSLPSGSQAYAHLTSGTSSLQDYVDTCDLPVTFNASTSGSTMTVHSTTGPTSGVGSIQVGMYLTWSGSFANSFIASAGTGTGGTGTYILNGTPASGAITTTNVTGFWQFSKTNLNILLTNWKAWAQSFGIQKMNFYEGGYSPDYDQKNPSGGAQNQFTSPETCMKYLSKFVASTSRKATGLGGYTKDNYDLCTSFSDGTFTAEFPSQYLMTGPYSSQQVWNMLETIYRTPNGPQFDAIVAYNQVAQYFINLRMRLHS